MESQNGGHSVRIYPEVAAEAQQQHPADYDASLAAALDLFAQDPAAARERFPEFSEHFKMSAGRENETGDEVL
jgi:hypothetical protein